MRGGEGLRIDEWNPSPLVSDQVGETVFVESGRVSASTLLQCGIRCLLVCAQTTFRNKTSF